MCSHVWLVYYRKILSNIPCFDALYAHVWACALLCRDSRHDRADAISGDLNELRPMTPLETSQSEPLQSKSSGGSAGGHAHSPPTSLGGTYKIEDGGKIIKVGGAVGVALEQAEELELLNESALESRRQLTTAEEKLVHLYYILSLIYSRMNLTLSSSC